MKWLANLRLTNKEKAAMATRTLTSTGPEQDEAV